MAYTVMLSGNETYVHSHARVSWSKHLTAALFLIPAVMLYLLYILYPIFGTFEYSLFNWKGGNSGSFVGLDQYVKLFHDTQFWKALMNNLKVVLTSVLVQIPCGLLMALLLFSRIKGKRLLQTVFFLPFLMPTVAVGLLWSIIYDPLNGTANMLLGYLGMDHIAWLSDKKTAFPAILAVIVWQFAPFYMILFKTAIVGIPQELYEAASMDGANSWKSFSLITLPMLLPTIINSSILAVIGSIKSFDLFYVMSGGGLNTNLDLIGSYMYREAFITFNFGKGSAVAFIMFSLCFIVASIIFIMDNLRRRRGGD